MNYSEKKKEKKFYITTPIFYPNSTLHLGHVYTMVITDCIARYKQLDGYQVYLQTGSDEHGEKIIKASLSSGLTPQELVDRNTENFRGLWKELGIIENHVFVRTSSHDHQQKVQQVFTFLLQKGDIYPGRYEGNYCLVCEEYVPSIERCGSCGGQLRRISEEAYFLKVEKYRALLIEHYHTEATFLLPRSALNELSHSFLKGEIPDLCVTRKSLGWGIPVPGKPEMTIYVWFDALLNYITSKEGAEFFSSSKQDTEIVHIIGKDIIRFHGIYWLLLLLSMKKRVPNKIVAHGWILSAGSKMSKSKGNISNPFKLLRKYGSDVLRAYLCLKITLYQDGIFSEELFTSFYQDFFVKKLGNLLARTSRMLELYNQGVVPDFRGSANPLILNYLRECSRLVKEYRERMDSYSTTVAFTTVQNLLDLTNKLISETAPWKVSAEGNHQFLGEILNLLANAIKVLGFLLVPFTPDLAKKIMLRFGVNYSTVNFANLLNFSSVGGWKIKQDFSLFFANDIANSSGNNDNTSG